MTHPSNLTPRQQQCMAALVKRGTDAGVALELGISEKGAGTLVRNAMQRMGADNRIRAAVAWDRWARQQEGAR